MNTSLLTIEIWVTLLGVAVLMADLWLAPKWRRMLGWLAAGGVGILLIASFRIAPETAYAFALEPGSQGMYVRDGLSIFFHRFFLLAAVLVLILTVEQGNSLKGIAEFHSLTLFALLGMLLCATSNDFVMMFAALELITITFVILNSFHRNRLASLEAGIKYLILGAVASAFMIFGIALVFGSANTTQFGAIFEQHTTLLASPVFKAGIFLIVVGLCFKIAAFPLQVWAPDVYQGAPVPAAAFLAVGSKGAGAVLLLRVLLGVVPELVAEWSRVLMVMAAVTLLYGSLCALSQRSLRRLMGYSSIANAGFLLLGFAALSETGAAAILYFMGAYLFTVLAAFFVVSVVLQHQNSDDIASLAGLGTRSPFLAAMLSMSMVSLAGVPPLAGFIGKFLLMRSVLDRGAVDPMYYALLAVTVVAAILSLYYYFGVIRAIYWGNRRSDTTPIVASWPVRAALGVCAAGMIWLGIHPDSLLKMSVPAVKVLHIVAPVDR